MTYHPNSDPIVERQKRRRYELFREVRSLTEEGLILPPPTCKWPRTYEGNEGTIIVKLGINMMPFSQMRTYLNVGTHWGIRFKQLAMAKRRN